MKRILFMMLAFLAAGHVLGQTSASFELSEHVFNAGGHPEDGTVMNSASFQVTLDAIGDAVVGTGAASASFQIGSGWVGGYPPPGECSGLRFTDAVTLVWDPEGYVGVYNLYRDVLSALTGLGYGQCEQWDLATATAGDGDVPSVGDGYFYLVTAENLLWEEGTKGYDSAGSLRPNTAPCP
jgi:hypothetical protein